MVAVKRSIEQRFMDKVYMEPNSGCWLWTAYLSKSGYGQFHLNDICERAHRASYMMFVGEIPKDDNYVCRTMLVLHKCDVPSCVNPDHLYLGTSQDNSSDMITKGRTMNQTGELNNQSKLNELQVRVIKSLLEFDTLTGRAIAKIFKIAPATVCNIKTGKLWGYI